MNYPRDPKFPEYTARPPAVNPKPDPGPPPPFPNMRPVAQVPHPTLSIQAVFALVCGVIGLFPVSIPLGIAALDRIRKRGQRGGRLVVTGFVASGLWIAIFASIIKNYPDSSEPDRDVASGQVTAAKTTRPQDLKVGDCVANLEEGTVKKVTVKPCDQPNGGRVFAVFTFPPGSWPGRETVDEKMNDGCSERWSASNEQATDPSDIFILGPTVDSWRLGDRGVTCLLTPK
ncbi:septum formation family protein [Kribbella sp. NPDC050281]|uniref:DUF4190 domain-containing protein n=1 Tax=Kribbella sp. NPDC050281 TaxID=3155515 RepID=UPI0033E29494